MPAPNTVMMRLLAAAAELRAAGRSWETVAANLGRSAETVRRWPRRFRGVWESLYTAAARDRLAEAGAEATTVLREHLRLEDTKQTRDAAKALLTAAVRDRRTSPAPVPASDPILDFASGLTDEQCQDLEPPAVD